MTAASKVYFPPIKNWFLFFQFIVLPLLFLVQPALQLSSQEISTKQTSDLYDNVQRSIQTQNLEEFMSLAVNEKKDREELQDFFKTYVDFNPSKTIMRLAEEKGDRMILHVLLSGENETSFQSWNFDIDHSAQAPKIRSANVVSSIDGLFRLRVSTAAIPLKNTVVKHHDVTLKIDDGHLFVILAGGRPGGIIFLGKADFLFKPSDPREQHQLILFNKKPELEVSLNQMFLRASANTLVNLFGDLDLKKGVMDRKLFEKALRISEESNLNAFGVKLPFGEDLWFPRLTGGDVYSELKTKVGDLVYQFAPSETEDIMLIDRGKDRIVSLYSSTDDYSRSDESDNQEIISYKMNLTYNPTATHLSGYSEIRLLCKKQTSSVVFKLNPTLRVTRIDGSQGSLIYFQERNTHNLHVVLNENLEQGKEFTLRFHYQGRIEPDKGRAEVQSPTARREIETEYFLPPSYLYSNSALWYPQLISRPYSPIDITISVPSDYAAISNGELLKQEKVNDRNVFSYSCEQPVKYFSLLVGRINSSISFDSIVPMNIFFYSLDRSNAKAQAETADRILRFYEEYFGKYPYSTLNLALRPSHELGGHAPATFIVANRVFTFVQSRFAKDPLYIPDYPDFFLAHEIAHQWWGQAVGWRSYRDQWLSEGFAHFAAAEYIRSVHGDAAWLRLSRVFYSWIENKTRAGPLWMGSRLGHLTDDPQAFSALLYNKGAYVLIMLKNWMGNEKFSSCLGDFFQTFKHSKASIEDFRKVAQNHSSVNLEPFFDQWLSRWDIPNVKWSQTVVDSGSGAVLKLRFEQSNEQPYILKLPVAAKSSSGETFRTDLILDKQVNEFDFQLSFVPVEVLIDPLNENLVNLSQKR